MFTNAINDTPFIKRYLLKFTYKLSTSNKKVLFFECNSQKRFILCVLYVKKVLKIKKNLVISEEEIKTFFRIKFNGMLEKYRDNILSPYNETKDENVGGSSSNIKHSKEELLAVKLADDKTLKWYESLYNDINNLYEIQTEENKQILKAYYLNADKKLNKRYSNVEVANKLNKSVEEVKTIRKTFIELVAVTRGYFWIK